MLFLSDDDSQLKSVININPSQLIPAFKTKFGQPNPGKVIGNTGKGPFMGSSWLHQNAQLYFGRSAIHVVLYARKLDTL